MAPPSRVQAGDGALLSVPRATEQKRDVQAVAGGEQGGASGKVQMGAGQGQGHMVLLRLRSEPWRPEEAHRTGQAEAPGAERVSRGIPSCLLSWKVRPCATRPRWELLVTGEGCSPGPRSRALGHLGVGPVALVGATGYGGQVPSGRRSDQRSRALCATHLGPWAGQPRTCGFLSPC